ncbi:transaldolase [Bowmanella denitrificans]|uniref:transaldolase n=1 Tax=Bowmanella denitrificans TaxID=366582 RepID=UPI000C9A7683|nr:transaldolase [Bowmanella denitrificans]
MVNQLQQLKSMTTVVADTGDVEAIAAFQPQDATTNPSLVLKAIQQDKYAALAQEALDWAAQHASGAQQITRAADKLSVLLGCKLLAQVPGLVSTEVDARLSFDSLATIEKAHELLALYREQRIDTNRVLIKVAATWEGIQAARVLEQQGIRCNLTLLFSFAQARACAEAGVYLISPFVGRILDWFKKHAPEQDFDGERDPGVQSVSQIYHYFKQHQYSTIVMGASFRNIGEIQQLAGCDRLTISPALLEELANCDTPLVQKLRGATAAKARPSQLTQQQFRWMMNEDAMATEKLSEGIRQFAVDQVKLEALIGELLRG